MFNYPVMCSSQLEQSLEGLDCFQWQKNITAEIQNIIIRIII